MMPGYDDKAKSNNSENDLVEVDSIKLFAEMGWKTKNAYHEFYHNKPDLGRGTDKRQVVLEARLRPALEKLNPELPEEVREQALAKITEDRGRMSPAAANRDVYNLLRDGVRVTFRNDRQEQQTETVRVIDWQEVENNDWLLSQFWVAGDMYKRRPDLIGFVNGIPLVFVELKAPHRSAKAGYEENLTDYKDTIPHLFAYNAFLIISNGTESRLGSITGQWEHFCTWKKINSEGEKGIISLETMLRGTCDRARLLDIVENFTLFQETGGGIIKLVGRNHQYLGVNNTIDALHNIESRQGKLGVFWHTQGSGKSLSMLFFAQKVLRTVPGNWTFVIITDREELDNQIYKTFSTCGVIDEEETQANTCGNC